MKITGLRAKNNFHPSLPDEDEYSWGKTNSGIIACVADGITRDPLNLSILPNHDSKEFRNFIKQYPRPSPAKIAAEIFAESSLNYLKNKKINLKNILQAAKEANQKIKSWNDRNMKKPNYLDRDLAGCVAIIAGIDAEKIIFAYNSDCGLAVFDENNKFRFITRDLMKEKERFMLKNKKISWNNPKERQRIRMNFRNRLRFHGKECVSYGAFTGEKNALSKYLIKTGKINMKRGYRLVLFSDGARDYFDFKISGNSAQKVLKKHGISGLKKYILSGKYGKRERTIVALEI